MINNTISTIFLCLTVGLLVGCHGGEDSATTGASGLVAITCASPAVDASYVASLTTLASSTQLGSAGSTDVVITAIVKNCDNLLNAGVPVSFSVDSGALLVTQGTTDASGQATANLSPSGDYTNRTITVTASASDITQTLTVAVTGTSIASSGESSVTLNDIAPLTFVLTDSDGDPISNKTMTIASALGNTLSATSVDTDANGQVQITLTAMVPGTDTITASSQSASVSHVLTISSDQYQITTPVAGTNIDLGVFQNVTLQWLIAGAPQAGQTINFSTTRGTLTANTAVTDGSGSATVQISSSSAGPATVTAFILSGPSTSKDVEFIATIADTIELQVDPATIGPNDISQTVPQQSTITATIRDPNNNLVKGKIVRFSITQDNSSGTLTASTAVTDSLGQASTTYVSSAVTTSLNGVQITALVQDTPAVTTTVNLTVAQSELFVILGTGNQIVQYSNTQYNKQYSVIVTDAGGNAVIGSEVNISVNPVSYRKGTRVWNGIFHNPVVTATCANEDVNLNGILDAGEDINSNGSIEPGNVVSAPTTVTTGVDGSFEFDLVYAKDFAGWVTVILTASKIVSGTEASHSVTFTLPVALDDVNQQDEFPPGQTSPFGALAGCNNTN